MEIKIGSRDSTLAVIQSKMVMKSIESANPTLKTQLITMKTTGDMILDKTLDKIGGKGLFVKELDKALADKRVDLTVHSFKDMPMELPKDLPILAVSCREDPRDVMILPQNVSVLDKSKPIGCSSRRRKLQLEALFPGTQVAPVRGNIQTRLKKLDSGEFSALILAYAGIKRLGLESRVSRIFEPEEILPAACQGILAVQGRCDFDKSILKDFHSPETQLVSIAERSFVAALDGGCSSPVAGYAVICGNSLTLTGFYVNSKGVAFKRSICGDKTEGSALGKQLAEEMLRL